VTDMKKIAFHANALRDINLAATRELVEFVTKLGHTAYSLDYHALRDICTVMPTPNALYSNCDFAVILGGDGTVLRAAVHAAVSGTPLLGVNMGHVGYLTDVDMGGARGAIIKVLDGKHDIEHRMMFEGRLEDAPMHLALNDITIYRGASSRPIQCVVSIDGQYMDTFRSDGLIISTPTGSTAYNLAAGGPVMRPDSRMMAITPISPHTMGTWPTVLPDDHCISVRFENNPDTIVTFDGEAFSLAKANFTGRDEVEIKICPSKYNTSIIKTNELGFYELLRQKLGKGN